MGVSQIVSAERMRKMLEEADSSSQNSDSEFIQADDINKSYEPDEMLVKEVTNHISAVSDEKGRQSDVNVRQPLPGLNLTDLPKASGMSITKGSLGKIPVFGGSGSTKPSEVWYFIST